MKHFIQNLKSNKNIQAAGYALGVWMIALVLLFYFLEADISQAPTFIYSQF